MPTGLKFATNTVDLRREPGNQAHTSPKTLVTGPFDLMGHSHADALNSVETFQRDRKHGTLGLHWQTLRFYAAALPVQNPNVFGHSEHTPSAVRHCRRNTIAR